MLSKFKIISSPSHPSLDNFGTGVVSLWRLIQNLLLILLWAQSSNGKEKDTVICLGEWHRESKSKSARPVYVEDSILKVGEQKALSLKSWAQSYDYMFDSVGKITQSTGNNPEIILMERGFSGFFSDTAEPINRVLPYSKTAFSAFNPNKVPKQKFLQGLGIPLGTTETVRTFRTIDGYSAVTNMFSMHLEEIMSEKKISNPAFTFGLFLAHAETLSMRNREYCDAISSAPETTKLALVGALHVTGDHVLKFVNSTEMHCCDHKIVPPMFPSFDSFNDVFLISAYQLIRTAGKNSPSTAWTQFFREGKKNITFELQRDVHPRFIQESESELPQILDSILKTGQRFLDDIGAHVPRGAKSDPKKFIKSANLYINEVVNSKTQPAGDTSQASSNGEL